MLKVTAKVKTYEKSPIDEIEVKSHWNRNGHDGLVVLVIDGKEYVVGTADLEQAISSCTRLK